MNKKIIRLTLSALLTLSVVTFAGCSGRDSGGETTTTSTKTTTTQPETTKQ